MIAYAGLQTFDGWAIELFKRIRSLVRHDSKTFFKKRGAVITDFLVVLTVSVVTVCVSLPIAVGVGVALSTILFLSRMSRSIVNRTLTGNEVHSKKMRSLQNLQILESGGKKIVIFELRGPLFFGSAESLGARIEGIYGDFNYFILDMKRVNDIDSSGANIILQIHRRLEKERKASPYCVCK